MGCQAETGAGWDTQGAWQRFLPECRLRGREVRSVSLAGEGGNGGNRWERPWAEEVARGLKVKCRSAGLWSKEVFEELLESIDQELRVISDKVEVGEIFKLLDLQRQCFQLISAEVQVDKVFELP